ncbi:MAG: class 1 fructose-bisphosphatase [Acidobacteria bacterium]|nr:class 1 fructose-bisphosphatase [Acidobacteriota bacterium]
MSSKGVTPTKTPIITRPSQIVTIDRYILDQEQSHPGASGDLSGLLYDIALTGKMIAREVRKAGLVDILGQTGTINVQGEEVQKLDDYAHECFIKNFDHSGRLCVMASEEEEEPIPIPDKFECGNYVLLFDPLDGSSNIDANVSIGSIFSIYRRITEGGGGGTLEDLLRKGSEQVAAGYVLYGSSTMLVYTTGRGQVDGFTLDPSIGEFLLSHADITIPDKGKIYSCNEGYRNLLFDGTRRFLEHLQEVDKDSGRPYSARYIGSMVADVHRTLLYGGIFMYPGTEKAPGGKLRLLYEANPMAMLIEQAGGLASTGKEPILELQATELHQRVPLFMGSKQDVELAIEFEGGAR